MLVFEVHTKIKKNPLYLREAKKQIGIETYKDNI